MNTQLITYPWGSMLSRGLVLFLFFTSFFHPGILHAQINSTTPNSYHTVSGFQYFEMPTASDAVTMGSIPDLHVVVATTPSPTLYWDDNFGHKGSLAITSFGSNTVFLDDVILTRPVSFVGPVAVITCREILPNNTVNIRLLLARWAGNTFTLLSGLLLDNRAAGTDWFDRVSISTSRSGPQGNTRQELFVTWQQAGKIWVSEGFINFSTNTVSFYNTKADVFSGITSGTLSQPDITNKVGNYKTVVAILNTGTDQRLVSFDYQNSESAPAFVPSNSIVYDVWYITAQSTTDVRTPRVEKAQNRFSVATATVVDNAVSRSVVGVFGDIGTMNGASLNKGFELACTGNTNYKKTGYPSIAITSPLQSTDVYGYEIIWQQVICSGSDFCTIQQLARRYEYDPFVNVLYPLNNGQYYHINSDLSRNSFFGSLAAIPSICSNYYAFGMMDKTTSLNGQVAYKKSSCNGAAVRLATTTVPAGSDLRNTAPTGTAAGPLITKAFAAAHYLYPNPVRGMLYIDMRSEKGMLFAEVYNASGAVAKRFRFNAEGITAVNFSDLPSGTYYLKISSAQKQVVQQKITVLH